MARSGNKVDEMLSGLSKSRLKNNIEELTTKKNLKNPIQEIQKSVYMTSDEIERIYEIGYKLRLKTFSSIMRIVVKEGLKNLEKKEYEL